MMRFASWAAMLVTIGFLCGCAKRETPAEAGVRTRTLLVGNGAEPSDLDPHVTTALAEYHIHLALFEGLTAFDEKTSRAVPAAAERWEVSADGLTWTFHLRPGLLWSNGDALTADDFVQAWRRALTPAVACPNAYLFSPVKNADAFAAGKLTDPAALGFAAPDPRTVVITLARPMAILPLYVAQPCWLPLNPRVLARFDALAKRGTSWTRVGNLVGNGPFTLTEWSPNARIVVQKNPRYWDAAHNQLERVIFFPTENSDTEERNFRAGQVHVTNSLPPAKIASYRAQSPSPLGIDPVLEVRYMIFNCTRPPFDNPKVRQALSLVIDRAAIAKAVFFDAAEPARGFVPTPCGDYVSVAGRASDPAAARRLLAEAGFPGGQGLPPLSIQMTNNDTMPRVGEILQAQWKKELGVEVTLEPLEMKMRIQNQLAGDFTISVAAWTADFPDPISFLSLLITGGGNNYSRWSNPDYDGLLGAAAAAPNPVARMEIFQKAEALMLSNAPIVPLIFMRNAYLIQPAVKGWAPSPLALRRYQRVRLEKLNDNNRMP